MLKVAVDGMGGDDAPQTVVEGAVLAASEPGVDIILVGRRESLDKELEKYKFDRTRISVLHASEVVEMHEPASLSVRGKKDSSISLAIDLVKNKEADALVTAGNTGAAVTAATLKLGMLPGIERAGIAIVIPTLKGHSLLIDVGANIHPKPEHLLQYGLMGDVYLTHILDISNPTIGLLNIGEEETKGTDLIKNAFNLLDASGLNFIGNVEGRDIFGGKSDCIICDGFVGNAVLKVSESLVEALEELLRRELAKDMLSAIGGILAKTAFRNLKKRMDYSEYGGALLLGINGICIISHGTSSAKAIKNAIRVAGEFIQHHVNEDIIERLK